jgi:hypothetical protein
MTARIDVGALRGLPLGGSIAERLLPDRRPVGHRDL